MTDVLLKIGTVAPDPAWQDGDIVFAANERKILCCHAESICHHWKHAAKPNGLRPDGIARNLFELTHEFRFERVSQTEIKRVTIATGAEETIGLTPNIKGEYMDVAEFLRRRYRETAPSGGPCLAIFGNSGAEVWYGGNIDYSTAKVVALWDMIEGNTPHRRIDFKKWPFGEVEFKHFLPIQIEETTDDETNALCEEERDETNPDEPIMVRRRKHKIDWRDELSKIGKTESEVLDKSVAKDGRTVELKKTIVKLKPKKV